MSRLAGAVDKAEKRGGKESLVLMDNLSFIVNVKERLVVTALDEQSRGEGVSPRSIVLFSQTLLIRRNLPITQIMETNNNQSTLLALLEEACGSNFQENLP